MGIADPETPGVAESLSEITGMAAHLKGHPLPPRRVDENRTVQEADGPVGFFAAVVPYLQALSMKSEAKSQMDRLVALKEAATGLYGRDALYYDQNLALFATGWSEQGFGFDRQGRLKLKWP